LDQTPPSATFNKILYQATTMPYVWGQILAAAGYTATDSNPAALIANLQTLLLTPNPLLGNWHGSRLPQYTSSTSVTFPYIREIDSTGAFAIVVASSTVTSTSSSGLNGLDTSSIAANSYYYPYAVSNGGTGTSNNGILWSKINSMVSGAPARSAFNYTYYRQMPGFILTDASANIYPHYYAGSAACPEYYFKINTDSYSGTTQVVNGQTFSAYQVQSLSNWIPPVSQQSILNYTFNANNLSGTVTAFIKPNGLSTDNYKINITGESDQSGGFSGTTPPIYTDSSQNIQYKCPTGTFWLSVQGCIIDQVS
jgi:hypothetical protein